MAFQSLEPSWDCGVTLNYHWYAHNGGSPSKRTSSFTQKFLSRGSGPHADDSSPSSAAVKRRPDTSKMVNALAQLTSDLPRVTSGIEKLQEEVQLLNRRVDHLQFSAAYLAE